MGKKKYIRPDMSIVEFEDQDIIVTSGEGSEETIEDEAMKDIRKSMLGMP